MANECGVLNCYECGQQGHMARQCPTKMPTANPPPGYGVKTEGMWCEKCKMNNHTTESCRANNYNPIISDGMGRGRGRGRGAYRGGYQGNANNNNNNNNNIPINNDWNRNNNQYNNNNNNYNNRYNNTNQNNGRNYNNNAYNNNNNNNNLRNMNSGNYNSDRKYGGYNNTTRYNYAANVGNVEQPTVGKPFAIHHPDREANIPLIRAGDNQNDKRDVFRASAGRTVYNKIQTVNLNKGKGGSQISTYCTIAGKTVLAIIDTGAEMSLIRKSIADNLKLTIKEAKFDLMSLSNMAVETFGVADTRVQFEEGHKHIYAQAQFSVVPDVIFDPSIGALLGMDILKPLKTTIALDPYTITINKSCTTIVKPLVDVRGIRTRDQTMAAVMTILFKEITVDEINKMVHDIIERRTEINEIPMIDSKIINVTINEGAPRFPKWETHTVNNV